MCGSKRVGVRHRCSMYKKFCTWTFFMTSRFLKTIYIVVYNMAKNVSYFINKLWQDETFFFFTPMNWILTLLKHFGYTVVSNHLPEGRYFKVCYRMTQNENHFYIHLTYRYLKLLLYCLSWNINIKKNWCRKNRKKKYYQWLMRQRHIVPTSNRLVFN